MISILFVDDDPGLLGIARLYVEEQRGFRIECASSAKEALRMLQETSFDVIVSDYLMPEMNGIEFLKKIRRKNNSIPFIIFTGKGREEIVIEALNAGADFYLRKDREPEAQFAELSHIIRKVVRQHRAEKELGESEERFRRITGMLTDYLYTVRVRDGRAVSTAHGAACLAVTGYKAEEFAADPYLWIRMVSDDERERVISHFSGVLSGKQVPPIEHRIVRKDGQIRWVRDTPVLQMDETGNLVSYDGVIKDITERKVAEETIKEGEDRFRTIINSMQFGIVIINAQTHTILEANPKALEMIGGTGESVLGSVCHHFICPAESGRCPVTDLGQTVDSSERMLVTIRGEKIPIIKSVIKTTLSGKDVLIESFVDITGRKRTEESLKKSESLLNEMGRTANIGGWEFDPKTREQIWTEEVYRIHEFDADYRLPVKNAIEFYSPASRQILERAIKSAIDYDEPFDVELEIITLKGNHRWVHAIGKAHIKHGKVFGTIQDITGRKLLETTLLRVNQKLNVITNLTRQDLTSQIFVLNSYLEMAKKHATGQDRILESLQKCEQAIRSINVTIEYSKDYQDMGAKPPKWQNVKMAMLFGLSHISTGEIQHNLKTENLEIFADPLLEKVCRRLFENSVKHGDHVTRIRVWHTATSDGVTIIFEDDGIGIPQAQKEQIFLHSDGPRASGGSLIFVREILDITGITIRETGEPGRGARFEMAVPKGTWRMAGKPE